MINNLCLLTRGSPRSRCRQVYVPCLHIRVLFYCAAGQKAGARQHSFNPFKVRLGYSYCYIMTIHSLLVTAHRQMQAVMWGPRLPFPLPCLSVSLNVLSHHTVVWGILSLLCVFCLSFWLFVCTVAAFSAAEKDRDVKFCMRVGLLSGQVFSPFGELWLAGSHGGRRHYFPAG